MLLLRLLRFLLRLRLRPGLRLRCYPLWRRLWPRLLYLRPGLLHLWLRPRLLDLWPRLLDLWLRPRLI